MTGRPKVVVLGLMSRMPVAGAVWQTLHYLLGLELLGFDAYYVEAHACTPTMLMTHPSSDGSIAAAGFISAVMHRFGFDGRWAFHALHHDARCYGMSERQLSHLYRDAACLLNLHGGTEPLAEHRDTGRLVYIETDPVKLQFEIADAHQPTLDFLDGHCAYFSFAENWGKPDCLLPVTDRYEFRPTRQPVIVDLWASRESPVGRTYTTIANWNQSGRDITVEGQLYSWSKKPQFLKFLDIPQRSGRLFELALSKPGDDQGVLEAQGWSVRPAAEVSSDIDRYRGYIRSSRGEFTVAKEQNVVFRSGWFSDRSVTYLASGRPVITQDTGLAGVLPLGEGLFAYQTAEEVLSALEAIDAAYLRHCRAAEELARTYFDHEAVLTGILSEVGLNTAKVTGRNCDAVLNPGQAFAPLYPSLPVDLVLKPIGKHPLTLEPDTVDRLLSAPVPAARTARPEVPAKVSIVVVTFDQLPFTRLCLESILLNTSEELLELVVVDNGSSDATVSYLQELAQANPGGVRLIRNDDNEGFPRAVNKGLASAEGETLVILNNDTIVAPGWVSGLLAQLEDPTVGMVGPVTNDAGNECRIPADYRTYGEFLSFCGRRPRDGAAKEVEMLTMFCVGLPRKVYETVGALDDGYGMGLFEDDDYAVRLHRAGYRTVCAEDVFVHHFGRASFGSLVPTGEYASLFETNRARFEAKWNVAWTPHAAPPDAGYEKLVERVRSLVASTVPAEALVAVASRGDQRLVQIPGVRGAHFPGGPGGYAGHYPATDGEAIGVVEAARLDGVTHLAFPAPAAWWLEHYPGLRRHLEVHGHLLVHDEETVAVYQLDPLKGPGVGTAHAQPAASRQQGTHQ